MAISITPVYRTNDLSRAAYLLVKGCRFLTTDMFQNRMYFTFSDLSLCRKYLAELESDPPVGMNSLLTAVSQLKNHMREAREANNG